jgi:membrane fusion protein
MRPFLLEGAMSLFRQEVIEFQQQERQHGHIILIQPTSTKIITWFGLASIAAAASFLALATYSHKQTVTGFLVPVSGTAKVFALHDGVIEDVIVHQGDNVTQGQPLFTVTTEHIASDQSNVQQQIMSILRQQKMLLQQQITAEKAREGSERERLTRLLANYANQQQSLVGEMATQQQQITLATNLVAPAADLYHKGLLSNHDYTARVSDALQQRQKLESLVQQLLKLKNQISESEYALAQLTTTMGDKVHTLENSLAEIEQRLSQTKGSSAYVVRAPTSGHISLLNASVGQAADPKQVQLEIIPSNSALEAELLVPPRAIGFVEPGQAVRIRYDAFPYQEFGVHSATVKSVSQTMLTDFHGPVRLDTPAYKVTASLDALEIDVHSRHVLLQPDMTLKADVILEKRPLYRWLLEPLYGVRL